MAGDDIFHDVTDHSAVMPDGRTVAWTTWGEPAGVPLLRIPGTPGSRWTLRADHTPWQGRSLRVLTTERPGYGASTRLPGRRFAEHADDLALILDIEGIDRVFVTGASGGAPHILAFAARHPDRVRAVSIMAGAAPVNDEQIGQMIDLNQRSLRLSRAKDVVGMHELLGPFGVHLHADPLASMRGLMAEAPAEDQAIMNDPAWQASLTRSIREALRPGIDGWIDECFALSNDWPEIDLGSVTASVTWWHSEHDRNAPFESAQAVVDQLPNGRLVVWPAGGHFAAYRFEGKALDELLSRG